MEDMKKLDNMETMENTQNMENAENPGAAKPAEKKKKNKKPKKEDRKKAAIEWGIYVVILAALFVVFHFFIMLGRIPSESMEPTLMVHDWTVGDRNAFRKETPQRGDMVIFYSDEDGEPSSLVKRVIGLPGETVSFVGNKVYIDGEPLDESAYLDDSVETECEETFTVPEDSYFMLGDNREISYDSRYWENPYITVDDIQSKVFFVIPFHKLPWF